MKERQAVGRFCRAYLRTLDPERAAAEINGPVYIRTARLPTTIFDEMPFEVGKGNVIRDGKDAVIFTCGIMVEQCRL